MKISDIIRSVLDLLDREQQPATEVEKQPELVANEPDLASVLRLAGLKTDDHAVEYSNEPTPQVRSISAVLASGTDVNKSKHPSDIRSNAPSMFPDFQAKDN